MKILNRMKVIFDFVASVMKAKRCMLLGTRKLLIKDFNSKVKVQKIFDKANRILRSMEV